MISGIITKGVGGFYYVDTGDKVYECRARGLFRLKSIKPMVGDYVKIEVEKKTGQGFIVDIEERKSEMMRPEVANVEQVVIVIAAKKPETNMLLLQKILLYAEHIAIDIIVVINKIDLDPKKEYQSILEMINSIPYKVLLTSAILKNGIDDLTKLLSNKISVFAGPSGTGKSSLLNSINPKLQLRTGQLSHKTKRGTHTTRHTELIKLDFGGMVVDTPGFTSFNLSGINKRDLQLYFPEFCKYRDCKFVSCIHDKEPECGIKEAVKNGYIHKERYKSYKQILNEIQMTRGF